MRRLLVLAVLAIACGQYPSGIAPDGLVTGGDGGDGGDGGGGTGGEVVGCELLGDASRTIPDASCLGDLVFPPNPCDLPPGVDAVTQPVRGEALTDGEDCWSIVLVETQACGRVGVVRLSAGNQFPIVFPAGLLPVELPCEQGEGGRVCRFAWADGDLVGVSPRCACVPQTFNGVIEDPRTLVEDEITAQYCFPPD